MGKIQTFQQFLATQSSVILPHEFIINLLLAALIAYILGRLYINYGTSLSNRRMFARNFLMLTTTTMLVITIVKSSLALSLGLVGALSIVRFRAAIKEPEELSFLFLAIAIGLGFGANQGGITVIAFTIISGFIVIRKRYHKPGKDKNVYMSITSSRPSKISLKNILEILRVHCDAVDIKRFDEGKDVIEASFLIETKSIEKLEAAKLSLQKLDDSLKISFLDNKGII